MHYEAEPYNESLDLGAMLAALLRRWPWLVAAVLVFAVLVGGSAAMKPEKVVVSNGRVTSLQDQIASINSSVEMNATEIQTNQQTIELNELAIAADEEQITANQQELESLNEELTTLREGITQSRAMLADPNISETDRAALIVKLPDSVNVTTNAYNRTFSLSSQITTAQTDIETKNTANTDLEARNRELAIENVAMAAHVAQLNTMLAKELEGTIQKEPVLPAVGSGAAIGAALYCVVMLVIFMTNKTLCGARLLRERYKLPVLGELYSEKSKKHKKFDRMLDKLSGDTQSMPEEEQVYDMIAAGVQAATEGKPVHIAVTGTIQKEKLEEMGEKLRARLPEGYEITAHENPVYNAVFLTQLRQYTFLLVEAKGVSDKREIEKLAEVLSRNMVCVLGAVVE